MAAMNEGDGALLDVVREAYKAELVAVEAARVEAILLRQQRTAQVRAATDAAIVVAYNAGVRKKHIHDVGMGTTSPIRVFAVTKGLVR